MGTETDTDTTPDAGPVRLRPPRHRVHPAAVRWWTARALCIAAVPVAGLLVTTALVPAARTALVTALAAAGVLGVAYVVAMPRWSYRVHRWEVTDDAVYTRSGWLFQESRIAPLSRVQTVDTRRGPLQRAFGLAGITVTTASAVGPVRIDGLADGVAADLEAHLTARTQADPGDAT